MSEKGTGQNEIRLLYCKSFSQEDDVTISVPAFVVSRLPEPIQADSRSNHVQHYKRQVQTPFFPKSLLISDAHLF